MKRAANRRARLPTAGRNPLTRPTFITLTASCRKEATAPHQWRSLTSIAGSDPGFQIALFRNSPLLGPVASSTDASAPLIGSERFSVASVNPASFPKLLTSKKKPRLPPRGFFLERNVLWRISTPRTCPSSLTMDFGRLTIRSRPARTKMIGLRGCFILVDYGRRSGRVKFVNWLIRQIPSPGGG